MAIQQAEKDDMLEQHILVSGSVGPETAPVPSVAELEVHASGHVEYGGEASGVPDDSGDTSCLVFRDEAERLAFMD